MKIFWILLMAALVWSCAGDSTYNGVQGTNTDPVGVYLQCGDSIVINADWYYERTGDGCGTTVRLSPNSSAVSIHTNLPGGVHQAWLMRYFDHDYPIYGSTIYPEGPDFQLPFRGPTDWLAFDTSGTFYVRAIAGDSSVWMSRIVTYAVHSGIPDAWPPTMPPNQPIMDTMTINYSPPILLIIDVCLGWIGTDSIKIYYASDRGLSGVAMQPTHQGGSSYLYWEVPIQHYPYTGENFRACVQTWNSIGWSEFSDTLSVVAH